MAGNEQSMVCQLVDLLKKNPDVLASVLQAQMQASSSSGSNGQMGLIKVNPTSCSNSSSIGNSSSSDHDDEPAQKRATIEDDFSAEDLLARRGAKAKGSKAANGPKAQQTFRFVLREAAKKCGIWKKPPLLRDIAGKILDAFTKQVIKALPQLEGHTHDIRRGLSESLIYRRNQLNKTKYWKRAEKIKKYKRPVKPLQEQTVPVNTTLTLVDKALKIPLQARTTDDEEWQEDTGFTFTPSEELTVMDGTKKVARATFLHHSKGNSDYLKLVLQGTFRKNNDDKVKLGGPNKEKFLQDIKVGEKCYWPDNQITKKKQKETAAETKKKTRKRPALTSADHEEAAEKKRKRKNNKNENKKEKEMEKENKIEKLPPSAGSCHDDDHLDLTHDHAQDAPIIISAFPPAPDPEEQISAKTPAHAPPPVPNKKYKGYVYIPVEDTVEVISKDHDTPTCINPKNGKPLRQRHAPKKV